MLWIRLRSLTAATLAVGIASGGAGIFVLGSQEPAPKDGQSLSKRTRTTSQEARRQPAATSLRAKLRAQQLATRKAKATSEIANLTRELAEIAVEEYEEVNYPRDLASVEAEIKLVESDLKRAEDRLDWARRMLDEGYVSRATKDSEELSLKKAQFSLEQAQSKRDVLIKYTKRKTIKELRSEVEKAHADGLTKLKAWELERIKEIELEDQLRLNTN